MNRGSLQQVNVFVFDTIECCQITVNYPLYTTKGEYHLLDLCHGHDVVTICYHLYIIRIRNLNISLSLLCYIFLLWNYYKKT